MYETFHWRLFSRAEVQMDLIFNLKKVTPQFRGRNRQSKCIAAAAAAAAAAIGLFGRPIASTVTDSKRASGQPDRTEARIR